MVERQVVVIGLEALSPLAVPCYGNRCQLTPELDRLAAQGLVFHEHYARSPNPEVTCLDWLGKEVHPAEWPCNSAYSAEMPFPNSLTPPLEQARHDWEAAGVATRFHFVSVNEPPVMEWIPSTGTRLIWLFVRRESADDNAVLAWLEQLLAHLRGMSAQTQAAHHAGSSPETTPRERWVVVTAARGTSPVIERAESTGVEQGLAESLGALLWSPLILAGVAGTPEFGKRELRLSSSADCGRILRGWFRADGGTESPSQKAENQPITTSESPYAWIQNTLAALPPGLLQWDQDRIAWRTEDDLLLVPRTCLLADEEEPPPEARFFHKPEDRFEVNDLATTVQELLLTRWQALRQAYAE